MKIARKVECYIMRLVAQQDKDMQSYENSIIALIIELAKTRDS